MKKKKGSTSTSSIEVEDEQQLEILKAAAQAWHSRSDSSRATNEFEAHKQSFKTKPPTRFRLEAMNKKYHSSSSSANGTMMVGGGGENWDFKQSLWDSYEIVAVSRRLEAGMLLDDPFKGLDGDKKSGQGHRRGRKESKNSLRNLFNLVSSKRFIEPDDDDPNKDDTQF